MSKFSSTVSDVGFLVLVICIVALLYKNSLHGAFIWDDRAAVVKNDDVHGISSFSSLFYHDFWGTDITRNDSHKSYRPLTVATFRFDYSLYALDAYGYHLSNIIVYALVCLCVYAVVGQWLSVRGSRIATLLFAFHPVHVEAVASIVGRADALCGLFYCAAVFTYTLGVRMSMISPGAVLTISMLGLGMVFAGLATLSKEIGFTVLGVFAVVEVVEHLKCAIARCEHYKEVDVCEHGVVSRRAVLTRHSMAQSVQIIAQALRQSACSRVFLAHMGVIVAIAAAYFKFRAALHGENMLYKWTMMENHVLYLPTLFERSLSYAQYHYLYLLKLVYPAELCFDYGYACVPTVHSIYDAANVLPLVAYGAILALLLSSVYFLRINLLVGLMLLVVPLVPALNVFVPVGTLLAERLLFIPSMGFCLLVGEVVSVDLAHTVEQLTSYSRAGSQRPISPVPDTARQSTASASRSSLSTPSKSAPIPAPESAKGKAVRFESPINNNTKLNKNGKNKNTPTKSPVTSPVRTVESSSTSNNAKSTANSKKTSTSPRYANLLYLLFLPLFYFWATRVISRNSDWFDEYGLYKSGLAVCPNSLKVLTNFAVLAMARGEFDHALEVALRATEIYPDQVAALINAGVAYQKLERFPESVDQFQRSLRVDPRQGKAAGYMGVSYYHWASLQSTEDARSVLRERALKHLMQAIELGFQAPAILHLTGSALLDDERAEEAVEYYEAALRQSANYASYYGASRTVPILLEDDVQPAATLNQLGTAYRALNRLDDAVGAFERGLRTAPHDLPMLTNLGNLYREVGETAKARALMQSAISRAGEHPPPALLNNLGLLELNLGNFGSALDLFQQALLSLQVELTAGDSQTVGRSSSGAEETIKQNIRKAQEGIARV